MVALQGVFELALQIPHLTFTFPSNTVLIYLLILSTSTSFPNSRVPWLISIMGSISARLVPLIQHLSENTTWVLPPFSIGTSFTVLPGSAQPAPITVLGTDYVFMIISRMCANSGSFLTLGRRPPLNNLTSCTFSLGRMG